MKSPIARGVINASLRSERPKPGSQPRPGAPLRPAATTWVRTRTHARAIGRTTARPRLGDRFRRSESTRHRLCEKLAEMRSRSSGARVGPSSEPFPSLRDASPALLSAIDPGADVGRAVAKRDAVGLTLMEEADGVAIHENDVFQIQRDGAARLFVGHQCGQFADV